MATTAWCPRCQKQVPTRSREITHKATREKRVETLCAECGILLSARTDKTTDQLPPLST